MWLCGISVRMLYTVVVWQILRAGGGCVAFLSVHTVVVDVLLIPVVVGGGGIFLFFWSGAKV